MIRRHSTQLMAPNKTMKLRTINGGTHKVTNSQLQSPNTKQSKDTHTIKRNTHTLSDNKHKQRQPTLAYFFPIK